MKQLENAFPMLQLPIQEVSCPSLLQQALLLILLLLLLLLLLLHATTTIQQEFMWSIMEVSCRRFVPLLQETSSGSE